MNEISEKGFCVGYRNEERLLIEQPFFVQGSGRKSNYWMGDFMNLSVHSGIKPHYKRSE
jgi:hypothetical protein